MQQIIDKSEIEEDPEDGCHVYGLFMESCRWDLEAMDLKDSIPGDIYSPAPIITFIPRDDSAIEPDMYQMPVYKTSERAGVLSTTGRSTNFIIAVEFPTTKKPIYWVLKGAALLCQLDN
jgi:dynein heavy chain